MLGKNPDIKRSEYESRDDYIFEKHTNIIPKRRNRIICVMLSETKGCKILLRHKKHSSFRYNNGLYITDNDAVHITDNGARVLVYMEGISTPLKMSNIERTKKTVEYYDLYGNKKKSVIEKIKGLKFDARILDTFTDEKLAKLFTKQEINNFQFFILLFSIITMISVFISMAVSYFFR